MGCGKSSLGECETPRSETTGRPRRQQPSASQVVVCKGRFTDLAGAGTSPPPSGLACQSSLRQIAPNYSLKRTVQSLRDWSCRLAHALGCWGLIVAIHGGEQA